MILKNINKERIYNDNENIHKEHFVYAYVDNRQYIDNKVNPSYEKTIYIGQTRDNVYTRWLKHNSIINSSFHYWIEKYGENCIKIRLLYTIPANDKIDCERLSTDIERYYIQKYRNENQPLLNKQKKDDVTIKKDKRPTSSNCKTIQCVTTNEIFNSIQEACEKYNLDLTTLNKRCSLNLNIGIDESFNPLFWKFVDKKNNMQFNIDNNYYIYLIYDQTNNLPLLIGNTKNIHTNFNKINGSADANWLLTLYRAKYSDHQLLLKLIFKTENSQQAKFKTAELIQNYSSKYIIFNKNYNLTYNLKVRKYIQDTFNIYLTDDNLLQKFILDERINNNTDIQLAKLEESNISNLQLQQLILKKGKEHFSYKIEKEFSSQEKEQAFQYRNELWNEYSKKYTMLNYTDNKTQKKDSASHFANKNLFIPNYEYNHLIASKSKQKDTRRIICNNTHTIFLTLKDAATAANIMPANIQTAISRKGSAGHFEDGTRLTWDYID